MQWGRGAQHGTAPMILAMIHDLPKHSRFVAKTSVERKQAEDNGEEQEASEPDEKAVALWEYRHWSHPQNELLAASVNALERLYYAVPQWKEGKGPKYPTVIGPRAWWSEQQKKDHDTKSGTGVRKDTQYSVADALKAMGATL